MLKRLKSAFSRSEPKPAIQTVRVRKIRTVPIIDARYDAAQTSPENSKHWQHADGLSATAAMTPAVRRVLRNRSRYEVANNSYAAGIVDTLAEYLVGTGPRLQLLLDNLQYNNKVEGWFDEWAEAIQLAQKLKTMRKAYATDGEAFALLTTNPKLDTRVKLDVQLVEADRVETPIRLLGNDAVIDGIEYDRYGNPAYYYVSKTHPGDLSPAIEVFDRIPASSMVHWFKHNRPGQRRGIPELTPCLNLFAQLRRYTLAVLGAAETAAEFAMVIFTKTPPNGEAADVEPMDKVELERRMATVLPEGWEMGQVKAEQPTTAYGDFKKEILNEIARCLGVPYNVAAGNSAGYNYASGRLDHQVFFKCIKNLQAELWLTVLEPILRGWLLEASLIEGYLPQPLRMVTRVPHMWFFDGHEHVDPSKEANAQDTRLRNYTTTYATEYAKQGKDWEKEFTQIAAEKKRMDELGIMVAEVKDRLEQPALEEEDDE